MILGLVGVVEQPAFARSTLLEECARARVRQTKQSVEERQYKATYRARFADGAGVVFTVRARVPAAADFDVVLGAKIIGAQRFIHALRDLRAVDGHIFVADWIFESCAATRGLFLSTRARAAAFAPTRAHL